MAIAGALCGLLAACTPVWTPPDSPPTVQPRAVLFVNGAHDGPNNFHTMQTVMRDSVAWNGQPCDPEVGPEENESCFLVVSSGAIPDPDAPLETRCVPEIVDDVVTLGAPLQGTDWLYHEGIPETNCLAHDLAPESTYVTTTFPDTSVPGLPAGHWTSVYALDDEAISDCPGTYPQGANCPYPPVLTGEGVSNQGIEVSGWKHLTISTDPAAVAAIADALYDS